MYVPISPEPIEFFEEDSGEINGKQHEKFHQDIKKDTKQSSE